MVISHNLSKKIMLILLKDFCSEHTVTSLAKRLSVSRVGIWKALRKLESEELIILEQIGNGRTSVYRIRLNWKNVLTERELSLYLTQEALRQKRWRWDFCELERNIDFTLLFGSILTLPKKANDIDMINVVSNKKGFAKIDGIIKKKQVTQLNKIHDINLTLREFRDELSKPNKAFVDAVKTGVVLFGQEKFVKFIKAMQK
ncbi:MAG: winged helix-turn-helix domain-containing protein [Nanoarchaeota archaeon]|nr:winged helix-turn-helix domain-containing protein [Nanoarchaeota archaeon]MBU1051134.1 winged helix-turn-helix domain-containing protein [Nanoarchaeota archaeon]